MSATPTIARERRPRSRTSLGLLLACSLGPLGCAAGLTPPPIVTKATLGKVVIYRNGVAYFERHAGPSERELKLRVPSERVDDFLKSLSIVDERTGEALPVSYPTLKPGADSVEMVIGLPEHSAGLRITYVTESPSWKPSYRLVVDDVGKGRLQGWAIVDNVSGEDWKDVRVGVGSTSALSFRYDLHSVRIVERAMLVSQDLLALAPPTGGSPFAAPKDLGSAAQAAAEELAKLDDDEYHGREKNNVDGDGFADATTVSRAKPKASMKGTEPRPTPPRGAAGAFKAGARDDDRENTVSDRSVASSRAHQLARMTASMLKGNQRLRVEGYAQKGDADPEQFALARANRVRNRLIAEGVPAGRIDAVGLNEVSEEPVKVAVSEDAAEPSETGPGTPRTEQVGEPLGQAHFVSSESLTIESNHSALVSILQSEAAAERVYYYDPISERGSKDFAFNAVRLQNPSGYMLDSGPFTIYSQGQFLGEGLSEALLPHGTAFIPYALDRNILVETELGSHEEIEKLVTATRGIVRCEARRLRTTKLILTNRGGTDATVYVRHRVAEGYKLIGDHKTEKLAGAELLKVTVPALASLTLDIEETTPIRKSIDLGGDAGMGELRLFLRKNQGQPNLAAGLARIVSQHEQSANLQQHIELLDDQMRVFRTRVDEINVQLFTLRKLPQGERLRQHLSDRMQEISDKLQKATLERAELDGKRMTARIELQDAVAELTLDGSDHSATRKLGVKP